MLDKNQRFGEPIICDYKGRPIYAKTHGQNELAKAIDKHDILFVNGPAGTGKTFIAVCKAVKDIDDNKYQKLVITRPAVESGEELGALPGDVNDKISPYMKPIYQCIEQLKNRPKSTVTDNGDRKGSQNGNHYVKGKKKKINKNIINNPEDTIENWYSKIIISPLAYMRGLTYSDSFIIMDEAQNVTATQMKLFLTRLGLNSKVVITGDASQSDLDRRTRSGFNHAQKLLKGVEGIGFITLTENDIVRHKLVKDIIMKYEHEDTFRTMVNSNEEPA